MLLYLKFFIEVDLDIKRKHYGRYHLYCIFLKTVMGDLNNDL